MIKCKCKINIIFYCFNNHTTIYYRRTVLLKPKMNITSNKIIIKVCPKPNCLQNKYLKHCPEKILII